MFKNLKNRKIARKLASVGSRVDTSYAVFVNNDDMLQFDSKDTMMSYIAEYRENNVIFKLQMYRIETYSL